MPANDLDEDIRYLLRVAALLRPHYDMASDIREWREKFTTSQQRSGLKAAFADIAEDAMFMGRDKVAEIDRLLDAEGFQTLSELQLKHGRRIKRLLKAKRLKNEGDAIALKSMVDAGVLTEEQEATVWRLIESFNP